MQDKRNFARSHRIKLEIEALGRAIEEITTWIDQHDSNEVPNDALRPIVQAGLDIGITPEGSAVIYKMDGAKVVGVYES